MDKLYLSSCLAMPDHAARQQLASDISKIGRSVVQPAAEEVDRESRFPRESIDALREAKALSAAVPSEYGGLGCSVSELGAHCEELAQRCSATAMILAMHHIQVACIARHSSASTYFQDFLTSIVDRQLLIASVTSEVGVGGDLRSSRTAIEMNGGIFYLNKLATTISYGAYADSLLVTARRSADAVPGDQLLVLVRREDAILKQTGTWDTLGMRGTCSPGFELTSHGRTDQILPAPFAEIVAQTMVPYSHLLWCALWSGIAKGAIAKASAFVRAAARKDPGSTPPTALRLAEVTADFQSVQQNARSMCRQYEKIVAAPDATAALSSFGFALQLNNLKVTTSQAVPQIIQRCLEICGIAAYRNDSPYSLGRALRDSLSATVMIGNDRILATNAAMLLVYKDS